MNFDTYGRAYCTEEGLVNLLYIKPDSNIANFPVVDPQRYNNSIADLHLDWPKLASYQPMVQTIEQFDQENQNQWFMPAEYANMDIAKWLLEQCSTDAELQRVGQELLLFQERNLFPLLSYLKYLVDTMREHQVVWGVGRGSSVASYVLYLIGVHKINSMYYDLDIQEFLKG